MRAVRSIAPLFVSVIALGGCATAPGGAKEKETLPAPPADGALALGAIAEPGLPKGECGMVLWTLDEERPSPVFRYLAGKQGDMNIGGAPVTLTLVEASGASAFGVSERQIFTGAAGYRVSVTVRFGLGFDGGTYLERGLVSVETPDGWSAVAPAAGLAGCRSK